MELTLQQLKQMVPGIPYAEHWLEALDQLDRQEFKGRLVLLVLMVLPVLPVPPDQKVLQDQRVQQVFKALLVSKAQQGQPGHRVALDLKEHL